MIICSREPMELGRVYGEEYELNPYHPSECIDLKDQPLYVIREVTKEEYIQDKVARELRLVDEIYLKGLFFYEVSTD